MAGDLDRGRPKGERFLAACGARRAADRRNPQRRTTYALAMVHALLGDEDQRRAWTEVTITVSGDPSRLEGCRTGFAPTFDALVALDRNDAEAATARLSADVDDREVWSTWIMGLWRPLVRRLVGGSGRAVWAPGRRGPTPARDSRHPGEPDRGGDRTAIGHLARGDHDTLLTFPGIFAELGSRYQERHSRNLLKKEVHREEDPMTDRTLPSTSWPTATSAWT